MFSLVIGLAGAIVVGLLWLGMNEMFTRIEALEEFANSFEEEDVYDHYEG